MRAGGLNARYWRPRVAIQSKCQTNGQRHRSEELRIISRFVSHTAGVRGPGYRPLNAFIEFCRMKFESHRGPCLRMASRIFPRLPCRRRFASMTARGNKQDPPFARALEARGNPHAEGSGRPSHPYRRGAAQGRRGVRGGSRGGSRRLHQRQSCRPRLARRDRDSDLYRPRQGRPYRARRQMDASSRNRRPRP